MTRWQFLTAMVAGLTLAVAVSNDQNPPRAMRPGEYRADQIAVLDAFGATPDMVRSVRRSGRIPVCWMGRADREKTLKLCADKGFSVYAVAAGSAGS